MKRRNTSLIRGSSSIDALIAVAIIVFVVLPVFSALIERYIILSKAQIIKDAVDITNIASYNALKTESLGRETVEWNKGRLRDIYKELLAENLNLNYQLYPEEGSIAEGRVIVKSLEVYAKGFPRTCTDGTWIRKPAVHSKIIVPVKPMLYRKILLSILGKEYIELHVHVDSDIPVNN